MSFNVKSEILAAIAKTDTPETKTLLLLMLGVLEEIGGKLDAFLQDEKLLREKVLNGHEPQHHAHHDWVAGQIEKEELRDQVCSWAKSKMLEEEQSRKTTKGLIRKFMEGAASQAAAIIITAISVALGMAAYLK